MVSTEFHSIGVFWTVSSIEVQLMRFLCGVTYYGENVEFGPLLNFVGRGRLTRHLSLESGIYIGAILATDFILVRGNSRWTRASTFEE